MSYANCIGGSPLDGINLNDQVVITLPSSQPDNYATLELKDADHEKAMLMYPYSQSNIYNKIVQPGDTALIQKSYDLIDAPAGLAIAPHATITTGLRMDVVDENTTSILMGAGGTSDVPTNYVKCDAETGITLEADLTIATGIVRDNVGNSFVKAPWITSSLQPSMEAHWVHLTGSASANSGTIVLEDQSTDAYMVMCSYYYGFSGSSGTYNAVESSGVLGQVVISNQTASQFTWNISKSGGDNTNVYVLMMVIRNVERLNTFPKAYSS